MDDIKRTEMTDEMSTLPESNKEPVDNPSILMVPSEPGDGLIEDMTNKKFKNAEMNTQMNLYDWVQCIVTALLCGIFIFLFIGRIIGVDGSSMVPTLHHGDKLIVSNLFFQPKYGDIIVLQTDTFGDEPLVKRVIATEGQEVDIDFNTGTVMVDGTVLQEDYIAEQTADPEDFVGPVTVPEGCVFVMGDNRNASTDSRSVRVGMVDTRCILGKVYLLIVPGMEQNGGKDWSRLGSVYS